MGIGRNIDGVGGVEHPDRLPSLNMDPEVRVGVKGGVVFIPEGKNVPGNLSMKGNAGSDAGAPPEAASDDVVTIG